MKKRYYSASTGGFYSSSVHAEIPKDAVEISKEEHASLLEGQCKGKIIACGNDGRPALQDPPPPTAEQRQAQINAEARAYLASTDWYILRQQETGQEVPAGILAERAAARLRVIE